MEKWISRTLYRVDAVANIIPDLATPITVPHDTPLDQPFNNEEHAISQMRNP